MKLAEKRTFREDGWWPAGQPAWCTFGARKGTRGPFARMPFL